MLLHLPSDKRPFASARLSRSRPPIVAPDRGPRLAPTHAGGGNQLFGHGIAVRDCSCKPQVSHAHSDVTPPTSRGNRFFRTAQPLPNQPLLKRPAATSPRDIRESTSAAGLSCLCLVGPREIVKSPHIQGDREATPDRAKRVVGRPHRRTLTIQVHGRAASHDFFSPPSKLEIFMSCRSPHAAHKVLAKRRRRVARILKLARDGGGIFTHKVKIAHKPLWSMQI